MVTAGVTLTCEFNPTGPTPLSMTPESAFVEVNARVEFPCPAVIVLGVAVSVAVGAGVDPLPPPAELQPANRLSPKRTPRNLACA